jgi:twitching motility two-component system response regulator PilG
MGGVKKHVFVSPAEAVQGRIQYSINSHLYAPSLSPHLLHSQGTRQFHYEKRGSKEGDKSMGALVLVVDESLVTRKILEICLIRAGYEVKSFPGSFEAFRWFATPEARIPALVIVDLCLPIINGYRIIQRLKAKPAFAHTVFVMTSQRDGVLDRLKGRLAGAQDYLTKPLKTQDLLAVVHSSIGVPAASQEETGTSRRSHERRLDCYP